MGSGPQFIDTDDVEGERLADAGDKPLSYAELRRLFDLCGDGDPNKPRYADMLAKASGLYQPGSSEEAPSVPDAAVAQQLASWLLPALRGLIAPGVTEDQLAVAVGQGLAPGVGVGTPQRA